MDDFIGGLHVLMYESIVHFDVTFAFAFDVASSALIAPHVNWPLVLNFSDGQQHKIWKKFK